MSLNTMFTIGHSSHDLPIFLELLQQCAITAVADVRSVPVSRFAPQFNREPVEHSLHAVGIKYVFLGKELGARTEDLSCYVDGQVQYDRLARTGEFNRGIERLSKGAQTERIAIMCTERDPLECHRAVLVAQVLAERGVVIHHIHGDGRTESHPSALLRLMAKFGLDQEDLFRTPAERLGEALRMQERRIAYVNDDLRVDEALGR